MSGGGGESNTVSEFKPPDYTQDAWQQYVTNATGLTSGEMPRYQGQTVAGVNDQQQLANSMLINNALNGTAAGNEANSMLYLTLNGAFDNPYATTLNPYGSESQYMDDVITRSNNKISDAYARGTQGSLDRAHALSRTMGSAQQQIAQTENDKALAEQLAGNTSNLLNQNYYANQGIAENQLNRASGALDSERNRQMQAAGLAPQMQNMDLQSIQALMGGGDAFRTYEQDLLNSQMQDWNAWMQSPYAQQDVLGSALTRASGGAGTTSSQIMQGMNPLQTLLGAGLLGAGMYGGG